MKRSRFDLLRHEVDIEMVADKEPRCSTATTTASSRLLSCVTS